MIRVLAETVTFTEEEMLLILVVLVMTFVVGLVAIVLTVLACIWAWRAGRGSRPALVGFLIVGSLEALVLLSTIPALIGDLSPAVLVPLAVIGLQVALYLGGRSSAGRARAT